MKIQNLSLFSPLLATLLAVSAFSMTDEEFNENASAFVDNGAIFFDAAFTNFLVAASTNGTDYQQVSAKMLLAIGCLEPQISERSNDFAALASSALDDIPGSHSLSNLWPSFFLGAGYVSYLCEQSQPEDGYVVSTNLLAMFQALGIQEPDSPLWGHAKRHLGMGDASLHETILFAAAAAAFDSGRSVVATNLSQSIPARLRELVFEHEWDE